MSLLEWLGSSLDGWMLLIIICLYVLYRMFGPGVEPAGVREFHPPSDVERELARDFDHEAKFQRMDRGKFGVAQIYTRRWLPKGYPKAVVVMTHGLNDHSGRLISAARGFLQRGYAVYTLDQEGFGRSSGRHGFFQDFSHLVRDTVSWVKKAQTDFQELKVFLIGGSMGGLLVVHAVLQSLHGTISGVILMAPAIHIHDESRPNKAVEIVAKSIKHIFPKLPVVRANRRKNSSESVTEANEAEKNADPLFYSGKLRIGTGLALQTAIQQIEGELKSFDIPYLLQHGDADQVCHISGSERFHDIAKSTDKTFITYPNAAHDLLREPSSIAEAVERDYLAWIDERVG